MVWTYSDILKCYYSLFKKKNFKNWPIAVFYNSILERKKMPL